MIRLRTGGKLNLFLRITGVREDGYHELSTLFVPIPEPWDELVIHPGTEAGLNVQCSAPGIDTQRNTLTRAYAMYAEQSGFAPRLVVELHKGIPQGAGLGGGSADAALLLNWLQTQAPCPLDREELLQVAARVGADVPFFLDGRPSLAQGIGEELYPVAISPDLFKILLLCPQCSVSTSEAYAQWDCLYQTGVLTLSPKRDKNHRACHHWPAQECASVDNCFEPVVFAHYPELGGLKGLLLQNGACAASLSGSGSAVFGLFREEKVAAEAARGLGQMGTTQGFAVFGPFSFGKCQAVHDSGLARRSLSDVGSH